MATMRTRCGVLTLMLSSILIAGCYTFNPTQYLGSDGAASPDGPAAQAADIPASQPDAPIGGAGGGAGGMGGGDEVGVRDVLGSQPDVPIGGTNGGGGIGSTGGMAGAGGLSATGGAAAGTDTNSAGVGGTGGTSGPTPSCTLLAGVNPLICDFEDTTFDPSPDWYLFAGGDGLTGKVNASVGPTTAVGALQLTPDAHSGKTAIEYTITGSGPVVRIGVVTMNFDGPYSFEQPVPCIDASRYAGIQFWLKGTASGGIRLDFLEQTAFSTISGPTYASWDYVFVPTPTWTKYAVAWQDLVGTRFGHLDPHTIEDIAFEIQQTMVDVSIQIDDVAFTATTGGS